MQVLVLFGGRSGEHEVSVISARSVTGAVEALGHFPVTVGISLDSGAWIHCDPRDVSRVPADGDAYEFSIDPRASRDVDVAFPVLHGPYGEDGCIQGLLEVAGLPYVGAGVEGSTIATNKVLHKRLFVEAGFPVVDFEAFTRAGWEAAAPDWTVRIAKLGFPCFAKPAHLGSSVGISKIHDEQEIAPAVERALHHDDLVLVEANGCAREVEVGVIEGREGLEVSLPGEPVPAGEFYDYEAKYSDESTQLRVPADVPPEIYERVRELAVAAFRAAHCEGFARVDFFWEPEDGRILVNEINSIPGMTPVSMFPLVWKASGLEWTGVVQRLLDHALDRHERRLTLDAARLAHHDEEVSSKNIDT